MAGLYSSTRWLMHAPLNHAYQPLLRCRYTQSAALSSNLANISRITSPSLWHSLVPKAFRRPTDPVSIAEQEKLKAAKSKEWNPATFFIAIAVLIGSNAIQMIALRNERLAFTRRTEAKIALLKETIERVRLGEDVDIERILGTGNPESESEWEEVMKEIEQDDSLWSTRKKRVAKTTEPAAPEDSDPSHSETQTKKPVNNESTDASPSSTAQDNSQRRPGFY
ncbi:hypothetical protein AAFC00_001833 [Neodothiora populina]|uniref:Cell division protein n=1 Tax=Neodothiora populina TaxID=2781224 RepID=A0ABR3PRD5_9PEZI